MKILCFSLGQLQANCYFLIKNGECLIIDPADEASFILEELQRRQLKLIGMLATHGHFDHIIAAGEIQLSIKTPLFISSEDRFLIDRLEETAEYFLGFTPNIIKPTPINLPTGEAGQLIGVKCKIANFEFEKIPSPGHTPGSCCYSFKKEGVIFTGDTLFKQGIGRYDFSYSNRNELKKSLEKLLKIPKDTIVYPGHGEETIIGNEKEFALTLF
ncbi:hypothetical protein A3A46_02415 [Candidatus Roizmanbacteria bacterium RIFCSPLOWO2_01_FULL_37_13]|uniref:Metallo-beta-lactamase domain-containing protein n=1 Tax=Candidatus Roizmanbacteria bacterium RIFCSPHIGHO2_02_FULL_38_11 TaxID=1802039 RepID=A0A1F7H447_9BACT|nr:MAG: hypothetical protein A3C25_03990 [Candidatus Roizmanbacteria bacterium RIFCSPHIGHO2_02_FULL_38_11]OGK33512.1 MAG: hypothetical protein A3F58_01620 [Candidatus Roizmanbacteria bacterium RIFCSPHIGHO2_12_FULL_37_9b]OGK41430.1 MAG: hypothetical protein A3A46_02415 [Candidatus Roizmanbacteria bacterium RIFCSPLOWO2_01_FULL_37_13]